MGYSLSASTQDQTGSAISNNLNFSRLGADSSGSSKLLMMGVILLGAIVLIKKVK